MDAAARFRRIAMELDSEHHRACRIKDIYDREMELNTIIANAVRDLFDSAKDAEIELP